MDLHFHFHLATETSETLLCIYAKNPVRNYDNFFIIILIISHKDYF